VITTALGTVAHWMSREPVAVTEETPVGEALRLMNARRFRHVLVMNAGRLSGIFSNRDLRWLLIGGTHDVSSDVRVGNLMTEHPVTVSPETSLLEAARAILERKIGALPVVEDGRPVGILTSQDALEALLLWAERER
jgi:CBS domain-containing protein